MKKQIWLLFSVLTVSGGLSAQTVYSVPAASRGNQLTLTIANESKTDAAQGVRVQAPNRSPAVKFSASSQSIKNLGVKQEADVTFTFDVGRDARMNTKDTLEFIVTDKLGSTWSKGIILQYTGPTEFKLEQNFPNPFNPTTTIYYQLPVESRVSLVVYDMLGREVKTLVDELQAAGYHDVRFDATGAASGVYFYRMMAEPVAGNGHFASIKKSIVLK